MATWTGDVKPDRAGPVKLQAGDLDAMLINLAIDLLYLVVDPRVTY